MLRQPKPCSSLVTWPCLGQLEEQLEEPRHCSLAHLGGLSTCLLGYFHKFCSDTYYSQCLKTLWLTQLEMLRGTVSRTGRWSRFSNLSFSKVKRIAASKTTVPLWALSLLFIFKTSLLSCLISLHKEPSPLLLSSICTYQGPSLSGSGALHFRENKLRAWLLLCSTYGSWAVIWETCSVRFHKIADALMFCWARRKFIGEINKLSSFQVIRWLENEKLLLFWQRKCSNISKYKVIWAHRIGGPLGICITLGSGTKLSRLLGEFHMEASVCLHKSLVHEGQSGKASTCLISARKQRASPAVSQCAPDGAESFHIQTRCLTSRAQPLFVYLGAHFHHISLSTFAYANRRSEG